MKIYLIAALSFLLSCKTTQKNAAYKNLSENGYTGLKYKFNDNGNRYLIVQFLNDSIVKVSNNTSIAHNYYLLNFTSEYLYKKQRLGVIQIDRLVKSDKINNGKNEYVKPYQNTPYALDSNAVKYIFPNIEGDLISFSSDFRRMQVREFNFEKIK